MSDAAAELSDVLVCGGGAAALAAAVRARELGLSATILEQDAETRDARYADWLSPPAVELCEQWGLKRKDAKAAPLAGLSLHSWDLSQHVDAGGDDLHGWIVDRGGFGKALARVATKRGATIRDEGGVSALDLGETCVTLSMSSGEVVRGKTLLIADGLQSEVARRANLGPRASSEIHTWCVHGVVEARNKSQGLDVVIGGGRAAQLGIIVRAAGSTRITIAGRAGADELAAEMRPFCEAAAAIAPELGEELSVGEVLPVGVALDLETHVGKRCLVIGDAGGFVAAFSTEGIYPAMRSGIIAAEVAAKAVRAELVQEELATFGIEWRQQLAEYLRTPSTDLSLLLPLVFRNEQMSQRVARAFLLGTEF